MAASANYKVDTKAPLMPVVSNLDADTGVASDRLTKDTTPAITLTAEAGATIVLFKHPVAQVGGNTTPTPPQPVAAGSYTVTETAAPDGPSTYTITVTGALADGAYFAQAVDQAGNPSSTSDPNVMRSASFMVDTASATTGARSTDQASGDPRTLGLSADLWLDFNEPVALVDAAGVKLYKVGTTDVQVDAQASLQQDGRRLVINPQSSLEKNATYYVTVSGPDANGAGAALHDLAGNAFAGLAGDQAWRFLASSATVTFDAPASGSSLFDGALNAAEMASPVTITGKVSGEAQMLAAFRPQDFAVKLYQEPPQGSTAAPTLVSDLPATTARLTYTHASGAEQGLWSLNLTPNAITGLPTVPFKGRYILAVELNGSVGAAAGVSDASGLPVFIDTEIPIAPVGVQLLDDSGVAGDRRTFDATPTLRAQAEPGAKVTFFVDGSAVGAVVDTAQSPSGDYGLTLASGVLTQDKSYEITAQVEDVAGNKSALSQAFSITLDRSLPQVTEVRMASDNALDKNRAKPGDSAYVAFRSNEALWLPTSAQEENAATRLTIAGLPAQFVATPAAAILERLGITSGNAGQYVFGRIELTSSTSEGSIPFELTAVDLAGNAAPRVQLLTPDSLVNFDKTAPASPTLKLPAPELADGLLNLAERGAGLKLNLNLPAGSGDGAVLEIYVSSEGGQADLVETLKLGSTQSTAEVNLDVAALGVDGNKTITARIVDASGNAGDGVTLADFKLDATAPSVVAVSAGVVRTYVAGDELLFTLSFSEPVTATTDEQSSPRLAFTLAVESNARTSYAHFVSTNPPPAQSTTTVTFAYTLVAGDVGSLSAVQLLSPGLLLRDAAGNELTGWSAQSPQGLAGVMADATATPVAGSTGSDLLFGTSGDDWLQGGAGEDEISLSDGFDRVEGGSDFDVAVLQGSFSLGLVDSVDRSLQLMSSPGGGSNTPELAWTLAFEHGDTFLLRAADGSAATRLNGVEALDIGQADLLRLKVDAWQPQEDLLRYDGTPWHDFLKIDLNTLLGTGGGTLSIDDVVGGNGHKLLKAGEEIVAALYQVTHDGESLVVLEDSSGKPLVEFLGIEELELIWNDQRLVQTII